MPLLTKIIWTPVWLISLPLLAGVIPVSCFLLDQFDQERRFTVGYHVTAVRSPIPAAR
jgi:hypothetical protein